MNSRSHNSIRDHNVTKMAIIVAFKVKSRQSPHTKSFSILSKFLSAKNVRWNWKKSKSSNFKPSLSFERFRKFRPLALFQYRLSINVANSNQNSSISKPYNLCGQLFVFCARPHIIYLKDLFYASYEKRKLFPSFSKMENFLNIFQITVRSATSKPQDFPLIWKFVRRMKGSKRKTLNGQIFEKASNLGPFLWISSEICFLF